MENLVANSALTRIRHAPVLESKPLHADISCRHAQDTSPRSLPGSRAFEGQWVDGWVDLLPHGSAPLLILLLPQVSREVKALQDGGPTPWL